MPRENVTQTHVAEKALWRQRQSLGCGHMSRNHKAEAGRGRKDSSREPVEGASPATLSFPATRTRTTTTVGEDIPVVLSHCICICVVAPYLRACELTLEE